MARAISAVGVALFVLGVYLLTSAGRIDIIDGQIRYEVAANWLDHGEPTIRDRALAGTLLAVRTARGTYGTYNAGPSVAAMPLMVLSRLVPGHTVERDRFAFSLTGPLFGAALAGVLVVAYGLLGLGPGAAVWWAGVTSFATLWWPGSVTVFHQNQQALFLLVGLVLAWQSGRRDSVALAAAAGVVAGTVFVYQEAYAVVLPFVGLAVLTPGQTRSSSPSRLVSRPAAFRYAVFAATCAVGLAAFMAFNYWRFGTPLMPKRYDNPFAVAANPLAGLLSLAVSPGKSVVLFSPPVLLAFIGARRFFARAPVLAVAVALVSVVHVLLVLQLPFFGGDWAWGPRYLLVLVPLWALAAPFTVPRLGRRLCGLLVALGLVVQVMGVSVDHQRFFLERDFLPYFWVDQWVYFKHSQLGARVHELRELLTEGVPGGATRFSPTPGAQVTYTPAYAPKDRRPREWVRQFAVFYTLRPWAVWIWRLPPAGRPVDPWPLLGLCGALVAAGVAVTAVGLRRAPPALADVTWPTGGA